MIGLCRRSPSPDSRHSAVTAFDNVELALSTHRDGLGLFAECPFTYCQQTLNEHLLILGVNIFGVRSQFYSLQLCPSFEFLSFVGRGNMIMKAPNAALNPQPGSYQTDASRGPRERLHIKGGIDAPVPRY